MSSPKPPAAPDPVATAKAQGAMNRETAITQYQLGATDQKTPFGNLSYHQTGVWQDGTPKFETHQSLSPNLQGTYDNLIGAANRLSGNLNNSVGTQFDISNLPARGGTLSAFNYNPTQAQSSWNGPSAQSSIADAGRIQTGIQDAGQIQNTVANSGTIRDGFSAGGAIRNNIANAGSVTRDIANAGQITKGIASGGQITDTIANGGQITNGIAGAGQIQKDVGPNDFSNDRQRVEEALFSRLNPQFEQDRARQEADLVSRGVRPGTAAYDRAMDTLNRSQTDARYQAVLAGGQEQSRMAGLDLAQGNFRNAAQSQQYAQNANNAAFANAAQQQQYGQNANNAAFANAAQAQRYGQNANDAAFANSAQSQQYAQNANNAAFQNLAQNQVYGQNANNAAFANAAQQQQFSQNRDQAAFGNAAQAQRYAQNANNLTLNNAAQAQQYGQNANNAVFGNAAQQQQFAQNAAQLEAFNGAQAQNFGQSMARDQFSREGDMANAQLQNQNFNQQLAAAQYNNGNRSQALQEQAFLRSLPMNEINALLSGTQIAAPQFQNTPQPGVNGVDYAGLVNNQYQGQVNAYNARMQNRGFGLSGLFGLGKTLLGGV